MAVEDGSVNMQLLGTTERLDEPNSMTDGEAATILLSIRQPRIHYNPDTKVLSHSVVIYPDSGWSALDNFVQAGFARLGETDFEVFVHIKTPCSNGYYQHRHCIPCNPTGDDKLHQISKTLKALPGLALCTYTFKIKVLLDNMEILSWVLGESCHTLFDSDDVPYIRTRVQLLFKAFESAIQDCNMTAKIPTDTHKDAKRLLRWIDENYIDHTTSLTKAGYELLICLAGPEVYSFSEPFYGRPGSLKKLRRQSLGSSTEHDTSEGSDGSDETY